MEQALTSCDTGDLCHQLPAMVIACKSDPDPELELAIKPIEGNEIGSPYGIGLVELSVLVQQGRHKMRHSFAWMLKSISKQRRELTSSLSFLASDLSSGNHPSSGDQRSPNSVSPRSQTEVPGVHVQTPESEFLQPYPSPVHRAMRHHKSTAPTHGLPLSNRSMSDGALATTLGDQGKRKSVTPLDNKSVDQLTDAGQATPRSLNEVTGGHGGTVRQ